MWMKWYASVLILLLIAVSLPAMAAAARPLTLEKVVYPQASINMQMDVNGAVAMKLFGGAIDQAAVEIKQQLKMLQEQRGKEAPEAAALSAALSSTEAVRDVVKSLTSIKFAVTAPKEPVANAAFVKYYQDLLTPGGWASLFTLTAKDKGAVLIMLSDDSKQLFFTINGGDNIIDGIVTTNRPMGELIAKVIQGAGPSIDAIMKMVGSGMMMPQPPAPPEPPAAVTEPGTPEQPETPVVPESDG